jgi:3-dehydroquinate synthase
MPELRVEARTGFYPVIVEPGVIGGVGEWLREHAQGSKVIVVCDHNTVAIGGRRISDDAGAAIIELDPGEKTKSFDELHRLCATMALAELDRGSIVVAVGGGVVGDLAGIAAAIYLRGIRLVQVPTTLLAMVDSSIGGKVGVNLSTGKNLVGAFKSPEAVFIDTDLLQALPGREFRSGMAEVIKSGLIAAPELVAVLDKQGESVRARDPALLLDVVSRTCAVKVGVVSRDEAERGERAILNYGHTFAHALEAASRYAPELSHGEAVSAGMAVAGGVGRRLHVTPPDVLSIQQRLLKAYGLPLRPTVSVGVEQVIAAMSHDKKSQAGSVRWVLLDRMGHATWGHLVEPEVVREVVVEALA